MKEIFYTAFAVIVSLGGGTFLVFALSSWLGKIWASRILDKEKHEHNKELETYKTQLLQIKNDYERYSDVQFKIYQEVWESLCDLNNKLDNMEYVDDEGDSAKPCAERNIVISEIKKDIEKKYIFLDETHYLLINELLDNMEDHSILYYLLIKKYSNEIKEYRDKKKNFPDKIIKKINELTNKENKMKENLDKIKKSLKNKIRKKFN